VVLTGAGQLSKPLEHNKLHSQSVSFYTTGLLQQPLASLSFTTSTKS
jgi:hypothetical protein